MGYEPQENNKDYSDFIMPIGKYAQMTFTEIAKTDLLYLQWFADQPTSNLSRKAASFLKAFNRGLDLVDEKRT